MAELTDIRVLEPHRWFLLPERAFRIDAPREGAIVLTRLPNGTNKPDILGDVGDTVVELVTPDGRELLPRPIVRHSPTGFEWGYGGSGPADLAANVLAVLVPITEAWRLHQRFKAQCISHIDQEAGARIPIWAIRVWIEREWGIELFDHEQIKAEEILRQDVAIQEKLTELELRESVGETIDEREWRSLRAMPGWE